MISVAAVALAATVIGGLMSDPHPTRTPHVKEPVWIARDLPDPTRVRNRCPKNVPAAVPIVEAHLLSNGTVGEVRMTRSSGCLAADRLLQRAMKKWKFKPALQEGKPVSLWLTMSVTHYWW